ncbi:hypothetical protein CYY_002496 [Polysphondylium violaceum]|uniref:Importin subunit alpha n=1 Tax=Polysphondylium violaceum TaxID=133409 RepID=A0A8J4Q7U5_9MYCE|nr:hypothetical protein CYY_002496 [Polysphondylium violaceum]
MEQIIELINSDSAKSMLIGTESLRKLLSPDRGVIAQKVIDVGLVPRLLSFLDPLVPDSLQFEASWCLGNIVSGKSEHSHHVMQHGALFSFLRLLSLPQIDSGVKEQCLWILGNIASDSREYRDEILHSGLDKILGLFELPIEKMKISMLRNLVWTLSCLSKHKPHPPLHMMVPVLSWMAHTITCRDTEVLIDSSWVLSWLTVTDEGAQCAIDTGIAKRVVELMTYYEPILVPALRTVGNLASGTDQQTQVILQLGALPIIRTLMSHNKPSIRKECFWILSNIAGGTPEHIQQLIYHDFFPHLLKVLVSEAEDKAHKKEIIHVLNNASSGGSYLQILYFVHTGFFQALQHYIQFNYISDPYTTKIALEALETLLDLGVSLGKEIQEENIFIEICVKLDFQKLLELVESDDNTLNSQCQQILTKFFSNGTTITTQKKSIEQLIEKLSIQQ